ncbi:hypothetical protein SNE40_015867 [Patella caerulea]|uniref:DDE Tnp4 domain-containing protein n=1 Tax=Patella caerulea TaxID=87958 RepID=A0AAN8PB22_PATCE
MRNAISAGEKLAITLRFLASGDSYKSLEFLYRMPRNTICQFIPEVCQAIYDALHEDYVKVPNTEEEWRQIQDDFMSKWQFPNCIGALDGKHVAIKAPNNSGSVYFNYKKYFSIILLALVDANCSFIYVDVGANGRAGDAGVYASSHLSQALENNSLNVPEPKCLPGRQELVPSVVVGDDAFMLKPYMMKPYPMKDLSFEKRIFNYRLSRARRVSENAFGILTNRFAIFQRPLMVSPDTAVSVVLASIGIHNFLKKRSDAVYHCQGEMETGKKELAMFQQQGGNRNAACARQVCDELADYFITNGQVDWQWDMV